MNDDGFVYLTCSECSDRKIAALFTPDQVAAPSPVCRVCTGEVTRNPRRKSRPSTEAQRRDLANVMPRFAPAPKVIKARGRR